MLKLLWTAIIGCLCSIGNAQTLSIRIEGTGSNLYLLHTVQPKESYYSIARLYATDPKQLITYNHATTTKPLVVNSSLQIPLNASNFDQSNTIAADEALVPLYHQVEKSETLISLSKRYNNVKLNDLQVWNNLKSDKVKNGDYVVVGFLKIKKEQQAKLIANLNISNNLSSATNSAEPAATEAPIPELKTQPSPHVPKEDQPNSSGNPTTTDGSPSNNTITHPPTTPVETPVEVTKTSPTKPAELGFFKNYFLKNIATQTLLINNGLMDFFKTTNNTDDAKYYVLINNVEPGTILKISILNSTAPTLYAKVLGPIPPMAATSNSHPNVLFKLSENAFAALHITPSATPNAIIEYYQ